jgi:hypothetical protein
MHAANTADAPGNIQGQAILKAPEFENHGESVRSSGDHIFPSRIHQKIRKIRKIRGGPSFSSSPEQPHSLASRLSIFDNPARCRQFPAANLHL